MSIFSRFGASLWERRITFLIWALILLVVFSAVSYNRAVPPGRQPL